jgi:hypothetical protein
MALIQKAVRERVKVKALLMSPSGAGKTYSALRLAKGMGGKTLLVDTEARRGLYYADEFEYDYVELKEVKFDDEEYDEYKALLPRIAEPFAPENYIALIKYAIENKYDNLIIDSLTHEWNSKGGILDSLNKMVNVKNDMQKWSVLTPRHNDFIYEILHSPINVIATVRGKDEYVIETNSNGKSVPKKIGLGAIQRDGMEFEYTVTFMLDQETHIATAQKDNTHLFDGRNSLLTEEDGRNLVSWANSGNSTSKNINSYNNKQTTTENSSTVDLLAQAIASIKTLVADLTKKGVTEADIKKAIKEHHTVANYNSVKDINIANKIIEELRKLEV